MGTPAQWAATGDTAAADALVADMFAPSAAVRTLLSLLGVADSAERAIVLLRRAAAAAARVTPASPRAVATIAVVRGAVATGHYGVAREIAADTEPGLREHLLETLPAMLARRGALDLAEELVATLAEPHRRARAHAAVTTERARRGEDPAELTGTVADPGARIGVLLAGGLVTQAADLADSVAPAASHGIVRTELAAALAARGDLERAATIIERTPGRARRWLARRAALAAAVPVPAAAGLADRLSGWDRIRSLAGLAVRAARAGHLDDAREITASTGQDVRVVHAVAVATAEHGDTAAATRMLADTEPDTNTALLAAAAMARHGEQAAAIALVTDPANCAQYDWEVHPDVRDARPSARAAAAAGEVDRVVAIAARMRPSSRRVILRAAAVTAARHGRTDTGLAIAGELGDETERAEAVTDVLAATAARGDLPTAFALLDEHVSQDRRLPALLAVAEALHRAGRLPATGLLERAAGLPGAHDQNKAELAVAEGVIDLPALRRLPEHSDLPRRIACLAAAQGRFDDALALTGPSRQLVVSAAIGGQVSSALAMAADLVRDQATRHGTRSVAIEHRDLLANVCRALGVAGRLDQAVDVARVHRGFGLRQAGIAAAAHGHLDAAWHAWQLVGGPGPAEIIEVAVHALDAALDAARTVPDDAYGGRDRLFRDLAVIAADRGLVATAAAAAAGVERAGWARASAWRHLAARFDRDQLRAAAAYLTTPSY